MTPGDDEAPDTDRVPPRVPTPADLRLDFGLVVLYAARTEMPGGARSLGAWVRTAERLTGAASPVDVGETVRSALVAFRRAGLWTPARTLTRDDARPGTVLFWTTTPGPDSDPPPPAQQHEDLALGIVLEMSETCAMLIEATEQEIVVEEHPFDDARIVGVGTFRDFGSSAGRG